MPASDERQDAVGVESPDDAEMTLGIMQTMRAMRRLKPDPVPREVLEQLVTAATWAPSAGNGQGYSFIIVTDRAQMRRLAVLWRKVVDFYVPLIGNNPPPIMTPEQGERALAALRYQREHFAETPALIVACYDTSPPRPADLPVMLRSLRTLGWRRGLRLARHLVRAKLLADAASSYPGVQNLLLAARALGLGANLTVWHLFLEDDFKRVLGMPRHVTPFALIPVGYPVGHFGPVRRTPATEVTHWDRW